MQIILGKIVVEYVKHFKFSRYLKSCPDYLRRSFLWFARWKSQFQTITSWIWATKNGLGVWASQKNCFQAPSLVQVEVNPPLAQSYPVSRLEAQCVDPSRKHHRKRKTSIEAYNDSNGLLITWISASKALVQPGTLIIYIYTPSGYLT